MAMKNPGYPGDDHGHNFDDSDEDKDFDEFGDETPSYIDPERGDLDEEDDSAEKALQISIRLTDIGRFCTNEIVDQALYLEIENEDDRVILAGTSLTDVKILLEEYSADTISDIEVRLATVTEIRSHSHRTARNIYTALRSNGPAVHSRERLDGPMNEMSDDDWEERQKKIGVRFIERIEESISLNDDDLAELELECRELMDEKEVSLVDFHSPLDLQKVLVALAERENVLLESPILSVFEYLNANEVKDIRFATRLAFPILRGPCDEALAAEVLKFLILCGESPELMLKGLYYLAENKDESTRHRCKSIFVAFLCKAEHRKLDPELTDTCVKSLAKMNIKIDLKD